jgi:hypothetical protein
MPDNMTSLARLWKRISLSNKILNSRYMVPVSGKKNMMEKYSYHVKSKALNLSCILQGESWQHNHV